MLASSADRTNEQAVTFPVDLPATLQDPNALDALVYRFSTEILASDRIVFDRFLGPSARLAWLRNENRYGYGNLDQFNSAGARLFTTIAGDSLRTAAIEALPLDAWRDSWLHWLGTLINGSVGNPEEEHVGLTLTSYSAVRTSWESVNLDTQFQWGIRPWRTDPYVYFLARAGHIEGLPLLTLEGRTGYKMFDAPKVEGRLTVQLPASYRIAGGASFDLSRMSTEERGRGQFSLTVEKVLRSRTPSSDAIFFLGFRSGITSPFGIPQREIVALAGVSKTW